MFCKHCGSGIDSDSKFCKECGANLQRLVEKDAAGEALRVGELIYSAHRHKDQGNTEEAVAACQAALALNPVNVSAHLLLGSLMESKGDLASAAYEYEKVLELDPANREAQNSVERLGMDSEPGGFAWARLVERLGQYRTYLPHAIAAFTLAVVLMIGIALTGGETGKPAKGVQGVSGSIQPQQQFTQPGSGYANAPGGTMQHSITLQPAMPGQQEQPPSGKVDTRPAAAAAPVATSRVTTPSTPRPSAAVLQPARNAATALPPTPQDAAPAQTQPAAVPVISPVYDPQDSAQGQIEAASGTAAARSEPPVQRISLAAGSQPNAEDAAVKFQSQGKYREAISRYDAALSSSANRGRVLQQMGLCYQRIGEHDKAVESYRKAIDAYKSGATGGADRNVRACEAGIQISQGQGQ